MLPHGVRKSLMRAAIRLRNVPGSLGRHLVSWLPSLLSRFTRLDMGYCGFGRYSVLWTDSVSLRVSARIPSHAALPLESQDDFLFRPALHRRFIHSLNRRLNSSYWMLRTVCRLHCLSNLGTSPDTTGQSVCSATF